MISSEGFLEFSDNDALAGFRLEKLELYNWGTFHNRVWEFPIGGTNGLLTGDIGSGKSTIVDAVTTLLVPPGKIRYNKAAGAEKKERTLKSYVLGYYKSERSEEGHSAKPVPLRGNNSYSVVLGVFRNEGFKQTTTLAQVFWQKDVTGQPDRFYIVSDSPLSIGEHFSDFGGDMSLLKRRLKNLPHTEPAFPSFPPYSASFRRRFGLPNEQALELFHQTVSMKSIGNLTSFVREHMLESFHIQSRIDALIEHFDNLTRAHQAVLRAKEQIQRLNPLVENLDHYKKLDGTISGNRLCRSGLLPWFSDRKKDLLDKRIEDLQNDADKKEARKNTLLDKADTLEKDRDSLKKAIYENGGNRLESLNEERESAEKEKQHKLSRAEIYVTHRVLLALPEVRETEDFIENKKQSETLLLQFDEEIRSRENRSSELHVEFAGYNGEHQLIESEIHSLKNRKNNIESAQLAIRENLCRSLNIPEEKLPFAGELISVHPSEAPWEGAIERLLHSFALSLLVPEELYSSVTDWINSNRLRGRLVFYKTGKIQNSRFMEPDKKSLTGKLELKPGHPMLDWLEGELKKRFDYSCCDTIEEFKRMKKALTITGLMKNSGSRHEKDDRHRLTDKSRYVLGWINAAKIAALEVRRSGLKKEMTRISDSLNRIDEENREREKKRESLYTLKSFTDYEEIHWQPLSEKIESIKKEIDELKKTSDILESLNSRLSSLEEERKENREKLNSARDALATINEKIRSYELRVEEAQRLISESEKSPDEWAPLIEPLCGKAPGNRALTVENSDARQQEVRTWLQGKIDADDKKLERLGQNIVRDMQDFRRDFTAETQEIDAAVDAGEEYRQILIQLNNDDLPRFENRFKELLNENTIREIANFQAQLNRERTEIEEKIEKINKSMSAIEYNKDRYIILDSISSHDSEIRQFRQDLKNCTEGSFTGSDNSMYTETKFHQVQKIIDRFKGREKYSEADRKWTEKVTDVRNWFVFAASERWKADDTEYEHHRDSGGKSGGQKEKLAYTVLAASLAYQFGLEFNEVHSRSFRFVVIDEAFGRGSDESARYGLELFKKLNLQLLVITPLQKIHIIEPYVNTVGFVHNEEGKRSILRNFTIEEYRAHKEERLL